MVYTEVSKQFQGKCIGIIGFGSFGSYLAGLLPADVKKLIFEIEPKESNLANLQFVNLDHLVSSSDIIFLAVPLKSYEDLLPKLRDTTALIVDLSSVKVEPQQLFEKHLRLSQDILLTHPLFGPETAQETLDGFKLIVTSKRGSRADQVVDFFASRGAEIIETTADDHDKQMSYTHVLTFFISRALLKMNIRDVELNAPSFQKLLALEELESHHSDDLFKTIQRGNPHGEAVRQQFIDTLNELQNDIKNS